MSCCYVSFKEGLVCLLPIIISLHNPLFPISRRDSHQRGDHLASGLASGGLPPRGLASCGHEEDDDEVVVLDVGTDKDDPTDSTKGK